VREIGKIFRVREEADPRRSGYNIARRYLVVERALIPRHRFVDVDAGERRAYLCLGERAFPDITADEVFSLVLDGRGRWWFNLLPGPAKRARVDAVCFEPYGWATAQSRARNGAMLESMLEYAAASDADPQSDDEALRRAVQLLDRERIARLMLTRRLRSTNPTLDTMRAAAAIHASAPEGGA